VNGPHRSFPAVLGAGGELDGVTFVSQYAFEAPQASGTNAAVSLRPVGFSPHQEAEFVAMALPGLEESLRGALAEVHGLLAPVRDRVAFHGRLFADLWARTNSEGRGLTSDDLGELEPQVREAVGNLGPLVDGIGIVVAPEFLEDARDFGQWWRRRPSAPPERYVPQSDPSSPYAAYSDNEWFRIPVETGREWLSGPFVDRGGTNRHICTLMQPIQAGTEGIYIGLSGADLRVGVIEQESRRALRTVPVPAAIVTPEGRVLGSNFSTSPAGSLLPGGLVEAIAGIGSPGAQRTPKLALVALPDVPWYAVAMPQGADRPAV
jgi:hypothetical protein